jgi:hypothetical protein
MYVFNYALQICIDEKFYVYKSMEIIIWFQQ